MLKDYVCNKEVLKKERQIIDHKIDYIQKKMYFQRFLGELTRMTKCTQRKHQLELTVMDNTKRRALADFTNTQRASKIIQ